MDLKNILNYGKKKKNIKKYKKPLQLREIESKTSSNKNIGNYENKSMNEINDLINEEKKFQLNKKWNKLNNGNKLKLLSNYTILKKNEYDLNTHQTQKLKNLLFNACENNKLNKQSDIIYDSEKCEIINIKILHFCNKDPSLKLNQPKLKQNTKSKSNIEKLLKSKKI